MPAFLSTPEDFSNPDGTPSESLGAKLQGLNGVRAAGQPATEKANQAKARGAKLEGLNGVRAARLPVTEKGKPSESLVASPNGGNSGLLPLISASGAGASPAGSSGAPGWNDSQGQARLFRFPVFYPLSRLKTRTPSTLDCVRFFVCASGRLNPCARNQTSCHACLLVLASFNEPYLVLPPFIHAARFPLFPHIP